MQIIDNFDNFAMLKGHNLHCLNKDSMSLLRFISFLFLTLLASLSVELIAADAYDAEGYPELYLRGTFDNSNWSVSQANRFNRDGDLYSLTLQSLKGEFKIGGTDWKYNLGATSDSERVVSEPSEVCGVQDGLNFSGLFETGVTISFSIRIENGKALPTMIRFDSTPPPDPVPSGTLPILYIEVPDGNGAFNNEIISKDLSHKDYFDGHYWIELPAGMETEFTPVGSADEPLPLRIKGRGNFTFLAYSKKPYKIRLEKKQDLLGLTPEKSRHYALLAHADDRYGYLRNFTGFCLGKLIGLPWTPSQQPVEVIINGDYRGLYFLTESIRAEKGRIDIDNLEDLEEDPELITGGYIVELDNYDEENQIRMTEKGVADGYKDKLRITFTSPEEYSPIQRRFIDQQFNAINDLTGINSDQLWSYLDLDDAVRYYLVEEIISHVEAYHGSTYLFRRRGAGEKWHFSPLWDCGNAFNGSSSNHFFINSPYGNTWVPSFMQNKKFRQCVADTWLWFMSSRYKELRHAMTEYVDKIGRAAASDAIRWRNKALPSFNAAQPVADNSDMQSRYRKVMAHLEEKTAWLAKIFGDYSSGYFEEPPRDTTPAAELPDFVAATSGIISDPCVGDDPDAVYYNLQGLRVSTPVPGQILIKVSAGNARKIIVRDS